MSNESDLEAIAFGADWELDNLDSLTASIKQLQDKIDSLVTSLPQKWKGDTSQVAVARLRVHKTNLGKIRTALNQGKAYITGSSEEACIPNSANQVRKDEAERLLRELPGGVIPPQVHDAVNRGLKYPVPGFGTVDVNTALSNLSNFFGAKREEEAEKALTALQKLAKEEADKFDPLENFEFDGLPIGIPPQKKGQGGPGGPGGIDVGPKTYDDNYDGNGYRGGPTGPRRDGNGDDGGGDTSGKPPVVIVTDPRPPRPTALCGVCSCRDHSGPGCGCVSSHPPVNVGPCGYPRCLCTSHSGGGCWCVPRHTLTHACGYGSCTCTNHSGPACWCVAGHLHTAPPPGPPQPPTGPNPPTNTGGGGGGGGGGTGTDTDGRPWANNYGNPSVDSRMDGSTMRNGLGAAGLGAAGLAAGSKLAGGGGLGAGLGGAGAVGVGGVGGAGGAAGAGAGAGGAGAGRGGSGLQGSASAAGKAGAAGGAGSGAAAGSGSKGAGRSGMMMGGQGGAADKKNTKRNGLGYVAPKIEDEGDGGPAAAASRAGSREP